MMDFDALALLENPDFHVESTLKCPKSFNLKDILKPTADRTEFFISAIVNFSLYKDNKMIELKTKSEPIVNELDLLCEQQPEWEANISLLNDDIVRHNEARENERPLVQEVEIKIRELQLTVLELSKHQVSLRTSYRTLKGKSAEMDAKISSAEFSLVEAVQENANLRLKIVQSPDKIQRALKEKRFLRDEAVKAEKLVKQAMEEKNTVVEVYTKALKKMGKHLNQMEKIQELISSAKSTDQELKLLKEKLTGEGLMDKQLDAKLMELNRRVDQLGEEKKTIYNERHVKIEEATRELNTVKQEVESRKQELETRQRKCLKSPTRIL